MSPSYRSHWSSEDAVADLPLEEQPRPTWARLLPTRPSGSTQGHCIVCITVFVMYAYATYIYDDTGQDVTSSTVYPEDWSDKEDYRTGDDPEATTYILGPQVAPAVADPVIDPEAAKPVFGPQVAPAVADPVIVLDDDEVIAPIMDAPMAHPPCTSGSSGESSDEEEEHPYFFGCGS